MKLWQTTAFSASILALGAWLGTDNAGATIQIRKKAIDAGYAAQSCLYCHEVKLPTKEEHPHNDRGKWLMAEKDKRKAKEVDPTWLKDYVEPKQEASQ